MTPIALVEAVATLLWTYTALSGAAWINHIRHLEKGAHVPAAVDLAGHLVPAMITLVVVVLIGALIGLPSVVAFIAVLFPAGTAYGTHMALTEARDEPTGRRDLPRFALTLAATAAIIAYRQAT